MHTTCGVVVDVPLLSGARLSVTPWTAACQVPLSSTISRSLLRFMSVALVMLDNHLIFCRPLLLLPSVFPSIPVVGLKGSKHNGAGRVMDTGSAKKLRPSNSGHSCHCGHLQESSLDHQERSSFLIYPKARGRPSRDPWTARRSNQFILKDISPECTLEGLMLKLKLQYFGHLM